MRHAASTFVCAAMLTGAALAASTGDVTFNKDVLPLLQKNCQTCHRAGEAAPMSLMTYQEARPYAKAMKAAVLSKAMPPWFADPKYGHFENERRLTQEQINTLVSWVDNGAPEGDAKDKPAPAHFTEGWNIRPDVVIEIPQPYNVPASGTVEYTYYVLPTHFDHDVWVTAAEVRPSNRAVIHHVIASTRPPGSSYLKAAKPGEPFVPRTPERDANGAEIRKPRSQQGADTQRGGGESDGSDVRGTEFLVGYAPGLQEQRFDITVPDTARLIPAGSDIVFQMHYTPNGKATIDQTKIGLTVTDHAPKHRLYTMPITQGNLEIPPGDANYESHSTIKFDQPVLLVWLMPHMHVRGKDFVYKAVYPTGETETLLNVPKYDFNWQLAYDEAKPVLLPAGTSIDCTAHHDNSANNKYNPNPKVTVHWGDQTWEEMMIGWFGIVLDSDVKPSSVIARPKRAAE